MRLRISASENLDLQTTAETQVSPLQPLDYVASALKVIVMAILAAGACALIPVFHFVLVPSALLLGLVLAARKFRLDFKMDPTVLVCPCCNQEFDAGAQSFKWPLRVFCTDCRAPLRIDPGV